ncbi:MAG: YbjQ family protein [Candidatus Marinimicrobia bacterium]|nr:YbjQ family protein [Candidatus Neomarinimicrobiota bacterium]
MIISTTETVAGYVITEHLGTVIGNTIRARHVGKDIMAGLRTIIGGEIKEYTGMLAESREQSLMRMQDKAKELGADAVVGVRFQTSMILSGTAELLVYGTAVKLGRT